MTAPFNYFQLFRRVLPGMGQAESIRTSARRSNYYSSANNAEKTSKALGLSSDHRYGGSLFDNTFNEFRKADLDKDGRIDDNEAREYYEKYLENSGKGQQSSQSAQSTQPSIFNSK